MRLRSGRFFLTVLALVLAFFAAVVWFVSAEESGDVVTATINYYYYDEDRIDHKGAAPFPAFVANMPRGSSSLTQKSPTVLGFAPYTIDKTPLSAVTVSFDADNETDVFYFPVEVSYVIRLNKQDLGGDTYSVSEIINGTGVTGTEPVEFGETFPIVQLGGRTLENAYDGFTLMYHVPEVIAADGSTEFECYYDRNYYMIDVDLGAGGYGVESMYVPYEYPLSLGTPTRTGYVFRGWDYVRGDTNETLASLPAFCPAYDIRCTARWEAISEVGYTVVYCNADLSDGSGETKYSHWGERQLTAMPDTVYTLDELIAANKDQITSFADYQYFTFDAAATAAKNDASVRIRSDGSTVVRLYYSRNVYKLRFIYARSQGGTVIPETAQTVAAGTYYLQNTRSGKVVTPNVSDNPDYLSTVTLAANPANVWTLIDDGSGGYYLQASDGRYLVITSAKAYLSADPVSTAIAQHTTRTAEWTIGQGSYCLNDKGQKSKYAGPSANFGDAGGAYKLIPADPDTGAYTTVPGYANVAVANRTSDGDITKFGWRSIPSMPTVKAGCTLTQGTVVKRIGNTDYTMPYVELVAEFNAEIEDLWPADVLNSVSGTNFFGSWSTEKGSGYRARYSDHANIVGSYPYMSAEMIVDPAAVYDPANPDQVAQNLYAWWGTTSDNISAHRFKIYYETTDPAAPGAVEYNGVYYLLDRTLELVAAHNTTTRIDPFVYTGYTIIPEEAAGHVMSYNNNGSDPGHYQEGGVWTTDFHYRRNTHSLGYYNYNAYYSTGTDTSAIPFGESLSGFEPAAEPPYPVGLEPDCYEFDGWYDSSTYDHLFDWSEEMPDHDVIVYAHWKPKTYEIVYYNDESAYLNGTPISVGEGTYGENLDTTAAEGELTAPEITSSTGNYNAARAGWYYYDGEGNLHAFDPATMTVSFGMHLFMRWSSNVPANFHVYYYVKNTTTEVAPETFGYSFVGLTRTFPAKLEDALNDGYESHYFPDRASTSILMRGDESLNTKTFWYTYRDNVPYTVKYMALDGARAGEELLPVKTVATNSKVVVTERFLHVPGYIPTAYYLSKTLIVSDDPAEEAAQNVIVFYYREDTVNMPYHIKYMLEDENGTVTQTVGGDTLTFREKNFIDGYDERGTTQTVSVNTYPGYDVCGYAEIGYDMAGDASGGAFVGLAADAASVDLVMDPALSSKELHIYYRKKTFPIKVIYQISSTDEEKIREFNEDIEAKGIAGLQHEDPVTIGGTVYYKRFYKVTAPQKYNTTHVETAPDMPGFLLSGNETRTRIVSDDDAEMTNNRIVFLYTALNEVVYRYYAVLPRGNTRILGDPKNPKLLSLNQEVAVIGERPTERSTAVLDNPIYTFVGWYYDEDCTLPVDNTLYGSEYVLTPVAPGAQNALLPLPSDSDRSFYALYDFHRGDLTVSVTDVPTASGGQAFLFAVRGLDGDNSWVDLRVLLDPARGVSSATVKDLPVGRYRVTQSGWSWRYGPPAAQECLVAEGSPASAPFTESALANTKWLDGNAYCDNDFQ